jgi:LemA protein
MLALIVLIVIVLGIVVYAVSQFNMLVALRRQTGNAFAQIDVQLKRRYDLIPNLVETVKGYMKHEQETLERVIQARKSRLETVPSRPDRSARKQPPRTSSRRP